MIELNVGQKPLGSEVFQEGLLGDTFKLVDVDADKIREEWKNSETGIMDKVAAVNDSGLSRAKDELGKIDKTIKKNRVDTRSIIARARNSVLQFPMYITQSCPVNAAQIINDAWNRVYTTLVQTVLSQNQVISEDEANDLVFLRRLHSNLKESADEIWTKYMSILNESYEPIDDFDQMMREAVFHRQRLTDNCYVEFRVVPSTEKYLIQENARLMNEPLTGLPYLAEANDGNTKVTEDRTGSSKALSDEDLRSMARDEADLSAEEKEVINVKLQDYLDDVPARDRAAKAQEYRDLRKSAMEKISDAEDEIKEEIKKPASERSAKYKNYHYDGGRYMHTTVTRKLSTEVKGSAVDAPKLLRDSDIKRINSAVPYTMEAAFRMKTASGHDVEVKYVIGVKTVMHMIRAQDLADDLNDLITGDMKNLRKVRYKTGEITFMDYLLNIKGLKADAAKHINGSKRWVNTLKRLGEYEKVNGTLMKKPVEALTNGRVPIPNGTLVLTQPDVTMLTNKTGIDLSKVSNAAKLAKRLFLITVIIVDSSAGTIRVLQPDKDNDWDVQSLASIESDVAKTDNSQLMRELNRMINH